MKNEAKKIIAYERPEIEVIMLTHNSSILEGSGDGNVEGPDDEIPD